MTMKKVRLMTHLLGRCALLVAAGALLAAGGFAQAQDFPSKRITIYVPFPPGAINDWTARIIGEQLQKKWGQPVVIENRVGGGGLIAMQAVANSPPDGHAMVAYASTQSAIPVFTKNTGIEPEKDLVVVTTSGYTPYFLVANGALPVSNVRELIAYAKSNPGKLSLGISGSNSTPELSAMEMMQRFGIQMTLVPYAGAAPAQRALLANETQLWIASMFGLDELIKAGRMKALAVLNDKPFPTYPDIPTFASATGTELISVAYLTFQARAGTSPAVLEKLAGAIGEIIATPEVGERIRKAGFEPLSLPQGQAQAMMVREYRHAQDVARSVGIKPQ